MGEADGPAAAEERPLLDLRRRDRQRRRERVARVRGGGCAAPGSTDARSSVSALVANRVCTTDRSSAKSSDDHGVGGASTGVPATRDERERAAGDAAVRSAWTTSVVVPEREIATSTS